MDELNTPIFTETDRNKFDALLYTAIFDEVKRLRMCRNKKERQNIRQFILALGLLQTI